MNTYLVGQTVFLRVRLSDPATGDPDDPTTQDPIDDPTLTIAIYKPDKTLGPTVTLSRISTGVYTGSYVPDAPGVWEAVSDSTGAATGMGEDRMYARAVP